jgi:hypothetical protein
MTLLAFNWRSRFWAAVVLGTLAGCTSNPYTQLFPNASITVSVTLAGNGGVESEDPAVDISCVRSGGASSGTCEDTFDDAGQGGNFRLIATPAEAGAPVSWAGCSAVSGVACILTFGAASGDTAFSVTATFGAPPVSFGTNLLQNAGFEASDVVVGALPSSAGIWQGDLAAQVASEQGVTPRTGSRMLKFTATGLEAGTGFFTSQQWQTVNLSAYSVDIDAGKVRLDAGAFVNRVAGDAETDTRFDLRVLAFPGSPGTFPADDPPPAGQIRSTTINSTAGSWQQLQVQFDVLPAGTRYVAVEIYPYEDVVDDGALPEFDGHYADDVSLVLTKLP